MRLSARLVSGTALIAIGAVLAIAVAARYGSRTAFVQFALGAQQHAALMSAAHHRLATALNGRCCTAESIDTAAKATHPGGGFVVVDPMDRVLAFGGPTFDDVTAADVRRAGAGFFLEVRKSGIRFSVNIPPKGMPIHLSDGRPATVHVVRLLGVDELRRIEQFYGTVDRRLTAAAAVAGLLAIALAWLAARRIVRPVAALSSAAKAVASGNLSGRVSEAGSDEIAELARSFNAMAGALERQETLRQNLVRDVAHELRSPLTALRCRLESIIDGVAPDRSGALLELRDELLHLNRLVDDLQELSLAEAEQIALAVDAIPLRPVVDSSVRAADLQDDLRLTVDVAGDLTVKADALRLRQILLNLLTNARAYTPPDGEIDVSARESGEEIIIEVHNTGSSLTPDEQAQVFERLYRSDPSRQRATGGAGIGLAIVKNLVRALGGRVWVTSSASGVVFGVALRRV